MRRASPYLLAGLLTVTGTLHFVAPKVFASIIPPQLPSRYALVYASGAAELACAAGLAVPRTRRVAGWSTALLFVAVFPANVQMALDAGDRSAAYRRDLRTTADPGAARALGGLGGEGQPTT